MIDTIDKMYFCVAMAQTYANGQPLTNATGFFFLHDDFLYFITARHVVINEACQHRPDQLQVSLHTDPMNLQQSEVLSIPLYVNGAPQWREHPILGASVDVVAVSVNDPHVLSNNCVVTFGCDDIVSNNQIFPLGQDVTILGFPLGFHDTLNNLPIARSATIASSYSHPFKGEPYFLTDARLHRGMSGSPVIVKMPRSGHPADGNGFDWRLLGIHSSSLDVSDRDPLQDERLALNTAWYAELILETISYPSRATRTDIVDGREGHSDEKYFPRPSL